MYMLTKTKSPECTDFMVYMTISAVRDYLGLALSAKDMPTVNKCEMSMGFVRNALELVKKLEGCFGHGR
jgi:hypothetical protein